MSNTAYNAFVILFGFCFLGLPIILISFSTAPPGIDQFNSSVIINTIDGDSSSALYLSEASKISGDSFYWDNLTTTEYLYEINNLTELIINEELFMQNVSLQEYGGFSKKVHLFIVEMNITSLPTKEETQNMYADLFTLYENGTYLFYAFTPIDYFAYRFSETSYPDVNHTIHDVYSTYAASLEYLATVQFYAEIEINNTPMQIKFTRLLLLDNLGEVLFFLTDEAGWVTVD
ncbi:MAG: hypothetical protein ACFFDS_05940 [Candidatus Thorarchaeota archaeon]